MRLDHLLSREKRSLKENFELPRSVRSSEEKTERRSEDKKASGRKQSRRKTGKEPAKVGRENLSVDSESFLYRFEVSVWGISSAGRARALQA